ncbi:MAG: cytochrome c3 family protein [Bacteroidota bacterium]
MTYNGKYALWIALILLLAACSVPNHYRTLSFFFDGVPDPHSVPLNDKVDSSVHDLGDSAITLKQAAESELYYHQPYLEKRCNLCHNFGQMGSLNYNEKEICYQCHNRFQEQNTFIHGPASSGHCTECHDPHKASENKLLIRAGQDLCLFCHSIDKVNESIFHNISEEKSCINCHNPHGGDNNTLLQPGTCFQCHDNFVEQYNVIHGPVSINKCSVCHNSHNQGTDNNLINIGQDLCFYCHDSSRLLGDETHSYIDNTNCTECHNPHGGEDRFIFR